MTDLLLSNVHLATMDNGYGVLQDAALAIKDGRIAWIGARCDAPPAAREHDCGGAWLTPGLIDCHTHIVHGGNRSDEWEARLNGASYEDIARAGGGRASQSTSQSCSRRVSSRAGACRHPLAR